MICSSEISVNMVTDKIVYTFSQIHIRDPLWYGCYQSALFRVYMVYCSGRGDRRQVQSEHYAHLLKLLCLNPWQKSI